ncbi:oligoribonuclease [Crenobacter intestini]|uniref:Oligoribonuclease n=1 Tax=Crenobacter intestini TaxID=2563443 RepID=A0A4T0V6C0_9NEIS|nr:oligoribonuclease [Crenobacter intestini]TIC87232.1 oligoribonuclease [Crenobacter intestini]
MAQDANKLIWLDMEMTGLDPQNDRIIEVAMVVTDNDLNVLAQSEVYAVHQDDAVLNAMDEWNTRTHGNSGLTARVRASTLAEADVEAALIAFMAEHVPARTSPMCGNSIGQDRRFMARWMPKLEAYFHYRNLDVSTVKELCKRWQPDVAKGVVKKGAHTALADILESIDELRYYRANFFRG